MFGHLVVVAMLIDNPACLVYIDQLPRYLNVGFSETRSEKSAIFFLVVISELSHFLKDFEKKCLTKNNYPLYCGCSLRRTSVL